MTEKHRLLVLASTYPRWSGDPEPAFVHELNRRLTEHFDVTALVPDAPGADENGVFDGVNIVRFRYAPRLLQTLVNNGGIIANLRRSPWKWLLLPGFLGAQYLAARRIARRHRVDIVHAHWLIPQGLIALALRRYAPYVVTSHGGDLFGLQGRVPTFLKRSVAASARAMTVVSHAMFDEAVRLGVSATKLNVIPMGVDLTERFVVGTDSPRECDEILFVGRLVAKKGVRHLIDAMPAVLSRRPAARLTIVGFGPEDASLKDQVQRLGLEEAVKFLGATPQAALPALYRRTAVLVAPFIRDASGDQEGLPVVLMEAIACGCPVVVGDVPGVRELLGGAADGIVVNPIDSVALADTITRVMDNPSTALESAASLRGRLVNTLDWSIIAGQYARILQAACIPYTR